MDRRYHVLDVFTDQPLSGNPLAVVLDSDGLDTEGMQRIAREFNLSETVFCAEPRDPVNSAALRIFTPAAELAFAGHPTIGTAILLATLQAPDLLARQDIGLVLEARIGAISCSVRHRRGEAAHAHFDVPRLPEPWGEPPDAAQIAGSLSLAEADIGFAGHAASRFSAGNPMTFVPLASMDALGRARLRPTAGEERELFYLYAESENGPPRRFRTRMLSAGYGVPEDPATGSAAAAFPAVLNANERLADGAHDCILLQGYEMGRPSHIGVAFEIARGRVSAVTIGGSAVIVAQGTLFV